MIYPSQPQAADAVADHYDELDEIYRRLWGEHVHHGYWRTGRESSEEAVEALADLVGAELAPEEGRHLCDIGCGYGATAARLAERFDVEVTGLTLSERQREIAAARPGRLRFLRRDWLVNGLEDAAFDGAYAIESSEHMADKQRFFDEAFRVLRPGAPLVVCAWLAAAAPRPWEVKHLLEPICREGRLPGMGSEQDYMAMARQTGFELARSRDLSREVRRTWTICAARFARAMARDPAMRRFVLESRNRAFALSLPRLIVAYRTGAMRYAIMTFRRP